MVLYRIARNTTLAPAKQTHHGCGEGVKGLWMSPNPVAVCFEHAADRWERGVQVYAYRVPEKTIAALGGLQRHDGATEIFIPEGYLREVKFLGCSKRYAEISNPDARRRVYWWRNSRAVMHCARNGVGPNVQTHWVWDPSKRGVVKVIVEIWPKTT